MTQAPQYWLKNLESALFAAKEIPLWGYPPSFPLEQCAAQLSSKLNIADLKLSLKKTDIVPFEHLLIGLGSQPIITPLNLSPLEETLFFVLSEEDMTRLSLQALATAQPARLFSDRRLQEGFYQFLILEGLRTIDQMKPLGDLSLKMAPSTAFPKDEALCIDISISSNKLTLWGRLICPRSFLESFRRHFAAPRESILHSPLASEIEVSIALELGHATLTAHQWKEVLPGDFVMLDRCSYDPKAQKGSVTITFDKAPLFRARLKQQNIKLLDYAYYYEEENTMDTNTPDEESEDLEKEEFSQETSSDLEDENLEEQTEEQNHLWSAKEAQNGSVDKIIAAKEIPLTLTIEVARLNMSLQKLLELKPGNVLELAIHPEQGVDVTINGKKVAKGELVKLGEALGVKILQVG